jgi:uncharacterized cupin superfamily protein
MTERTAGVFVSRVDAADWQHDEETGGLVHLLRADHVVQAGLWKPGPLAGEVIEFTLAADETLLVLEGRGSLGIDGRPSVELTPGDMISLAKGMRTRWVVDADFKEFWVYAQASNASASA